MAKAPKKVAATKAAPEKMPPPAAKKTAAPKAAAPKTPKAAAPKTPKPEAPPPPPAVDVAALEAELHERRATEKLLRDEIAAVQAQLADARNTNELLQKELEVAQTELKLAQAKLKEHVDHEWATHATEQEIKDAREAATRAERAVEAARAEAAVLRTEIERLRSQLHGKDNRPPTLQGVGDPTPPGTPTAARDENAPAPVDENAPQKAMPSDETAKNVLDEKQPGFWGRLFKSNKKED